MGQRFGAQSVAELYRFRPPYSEEVFTLLRELRADRTPVVLDAGCGPGKIARALALEVERVDAVDVSAAMIEVGRSLPNGDHPALHWLCSSIEEAPLRPPYGLAVAGASFHWFAADRTLELLADVLEPGALFIVLAGDGAWKAPWADAEQEVMIEFVTQMEGERPTWHPSDIEETRLLDSEGFELRGHRVTAPDPFEQSVDDYVACQHSRATLTLEAMGAELASEFDAALAKVLAPHARNGLLTYDRRTRVEWGVPHGVR
jgi:SAM-dependent methyltransferase